VKLLSKLSSDARAVLATFAGTSGGVTILALSLLLGLAYSFVMPFISLFGTREVSAGIVYTLRGARSLATGI
jgi:hypothetical protein